MQPRHVMWGAALALITLTSVITGWRRWQEQERIARAWAAVPLVPDLRRWPGELARRIQSTTGELFAAEDPVPSLAKLAAIYHVNGFAPEAVQLLEALQSLDGRNARWPYLLADLHLRAGDTVRAERGVQAALELDPTYVPGWIRLGFLQAQRDAPDIARASYERAVARARADVRAVFALLAFEVRQGERADTRRQLMALSGAHPELVPPHELLAQLLAAAGDHDGAARERRLAATADRGISQADPWIDALADYCFDPNRLSLIATAAYREGRWTEAETLLSRAIELTPTDATLWISLSGLCEKQGRLADARAVFERAVAVCPDPALHVQLTRLLRLEHRIGDAEKVVRTALRRWPADAELHAALGFAHRDARRLPEALQSFRDAVRLNPTLVEAQYTLGWCLMQLGQRDEARAAVEKSLVMRPDYAEALFFLGALAVESGDVAAAGTHILRLHALRPDQPGTHELFGALHLLRGRAALQAGDPLAAEREFRNGLNAVPKFVPLLLEAGLLAFRQEHYVEAADLFERYVQIEPADPRGYAMQGRALRSLGREPEARAVFTRGVEAARKGHQSAQLEELQRLLAP